MRRTEPGPSDSVETRAARLFLIAGAICALARLALLGAFPLTDTTEARYAEIAREMLATGDWVSLQLDPGVPFWGKPPLSTWLTAASMAVFGVNEFGARFSSWMLSLMIAALTFGLGRKHLGLLGAALAVAIMWSTPLFFILSGAVMTDTALLLATTLSMWGFWRSVAAEDGSAKLSGLLFFIGLGIGLLAKGPVALVLVLFPIGVWGLVCGRLGETWRRLPWISGSLLCVLVALPWYVLAELRTPGFLRYFLVGEHWMRFTVPGWKGDLYGLVQSRPIGFVWIFAVVGALPWSLLSLALGWMGIAKGGGRVITRDDWLLYLACWMLAPLAFFTFSHSVVWTYVLPGLPAFALLTSGFIAPKAASWRIALAGLVAITPAVSMLAVALALPHYLPGRSQKNLVEAYLRLRGEPSERLVYLSPMPRSAKFYSRGESVAVGSQKEAARAIAAPTRDFFAVRESDWGQFPPETRANVYVVQRIGAFLLLRERP